MSLTFALLEGLSLLVQEHDCVFFSSLFLAGSIVDLYKEIEISTCNTF